MAKLFVHVSKTEILSTVSMCNNQQHNENLLYEKRLPLNLETGEKTTLKLAEINLSLTYLGRAWYRWVVSHLFVRKYWLGWRQRFCWWGPNYGTWWGIKTSFWQLLTDWTSTRRCCLDFGHFFSKHIKAKQTSRTGLYWI